MHRQSSFQNVLPNWLLTILWIIQCNLLNLLTSTTWEPSISCKLMSAVSLYFNMPVTQPFSVISIQAVIHVQNTTTLWYSNVCLAHSMTRLLNLAHDLLSSDSQSWADLAMKWMKSSKAVVAKSALSSLAGQCHPSSLSGEWTSSPRRRFRWCLQGTHLDLQSVLNTP